MTPTEQAWQAVTPAALDWTETGEPVSTDFKDVYYSRDNGLAESEHVFLAGNNLPQRWLVRQAPYFCIAETGFGTGLNFLVTWQAWRKLSHPRPRLHYLSVEKFPLAQADLARALAVWPELASLAAQLLALYPALVPGQHRLLLEQGELMLDLWWDDAAKALADLASHQTKMVDAWFLDGFAPARNQAMWTREVMESVALLSRPDATFSTFTAAGSVRRRLQGSGFTVEKVAGYGRKRECLRGALAAAPPARLQVSSSQWDIPTATQAPPAQAIVLGAGLAGCTVAAALARRGVAVTLLDRGLIASGGSGNEQGILYTRLSRTHSPLADFSLQSFCFSVRFYQTLFDTGVLREGVDGALCGSFHQFDHAQNSDTLATELERVPQLARLLGAEDACAILGIRQAAAGHWFPHSGWMHPGAVCRALAGHSGIQVIENCDDISLSRTRAGWLGRAADGRRWEAPCAVVATGTESVNTPGLDWLPLRSIRGQTTLLPSNHEFGALAAALCHTGYIAPARSGVHCIGASFDLDDVDPRPRVEDHRNNLEKLALAVPDWRASLSRLDPAALDGRVGFRCASPDYLPLAGPVPDRQAFLERFSGLRKNARQTIALSGEYLSGLYLSTGHGSRGLTSTPLVAEYLASRICGEPPPLRRDLIRALAPARFIIRDLSRNRI